MSQALKYDYTFDPDDDSIAARVCRLTGANKHVLELGCAAGAMSKVLHHHYHCTVTGVEFDGSAAALAREFCDEVLVGDLDQPELLGSLSKSFDVVLMADVLEHLRQPEQCIRQVLELLNEDGYLVISIPNIANGGVIAALWCDAFNYADKGLLDRTHIHFFTTSTLYRLLEKCGLVIDHLDYLDGGRWHTEFAEFWEQLPPALHQALEQHPPAQAFQIIMRARRPKYENETSIPLDRISTSDPFANWPTPEPEPVIAIEPIPEPAPEPEPISPRQAKITALLQRCPRLNAWAQRTLSPELKAKIKRFLS